MAKSPNIINSDILYCHEGKETRPVDLNFGEAEMLPAGTLIDSEGNAVNDLTAMGILLQDVWKNYWSGRGIMLTAGHVDLEKAQASSGITYSSEAKAALKGICFVGDTDVPAVAGHTHAWDDLTDKPFGETVIVEGYEGEDNTLVAEGSHDGVNHSGCLQTNGIDFEGFVLGESYRLETGDYVFEAEVSEVDTGVLGIQLVYDGVDKGYIYRGECNTCGTSLLIEPSGGTYAVSGSFGLYRTYHVIEEVTEIETLDEKYMPLLTDSNGVQYKLVVSTDGALSAEAVTE